ncbi:L-threonylcarbamoyladenylate synthase [Alteribacter populi]|uniref:L-threonylcarbamoyladenylate synthase n=1 Tax=Alteribacter populi TaxID=2011011 RepID=UPI000BBB03CF|nr:L-threonylcarbamoyladenylate synthase [Alteribacter populi]
MNTHYWVVDEGVDNLCEHPQIKAAAQLLKDQQVVAFPTETVYGLGGNAQSDDAIDRVFQAKGRPSDNPLIVHIASRDLVYDYVSTVNKKAKQLMDAFWPGPLTIVFPHNGTLSTKVTAELPTVAIRMPDHPVALAILTEAALPVAAPSANTSGRPSPTTADHVFGDLDGKIAGIVNGGPTGVGVESTVIDCSGEVPMILRPGGLTKEKIERVVGPVDVDPSLIEEQEAPRSPGMKYTHYAPIAKVTLVEGTDSFFQRQIDKAKQEGLGVGVLVTEEKAGSFEGVTTVTCGTRDNLASVARGLYGALRQFDDHGEVDVIIAQVYPETDIGQAIMNRLRKAAANRIVVENEE